MCNMLIETEQENINTWDEFNVLIGELKDIMITETRKLAHQLDIPETLAEQIGYLRKQFHWTKELEERIIKCYRRYRK